MKIEGPSSSEWLTGEQLPIGKLAIVKCDRDYQIYPTDSTICLKCPDQLIVLTAKTGADAWGVIPALWRFKLLQPGQSVTLTQE